MSVIEDTMVEQQHRYELHPSPTTVCPRSWPTRTEREAFRKKLPSYKILARDVKALNKENKTLKKENRDLKKEAEALKKKNEALNKDLHDSCNQMKEETRETRMATVLYKDLFLGVKEENQRLNNELESSRKSPSAAPHEMEVLIIAMSSQIHVLCGALVVIRKKLKETRKKHAATLKKHRRAYHFHQIWKKKRPVYRRTQLKPVAAFVVWILRITNNLILF